MWLQRAHAASVDNMNYIELCLIESNRCLTMSLPAVRMLCLCFHSLEYTGHWNICGVGLRCRQTRSPLLTSGSETIRLREVEYNVCLE